MSSQNLQSCKQSSIQPQTIPPCLSHVAGFLLGRTARILQEKVTRALLPLRLTPKDVGMLRILDREGPLTQQALGKKHDIDRTTVVQMLDELESRQLVIRVPNAEDRRSYLIYLTPRGKKTLAQCLKLTDKEQAEFLTPLDQEEWEALRTMLIKLLNYHQLTGR